MEALDYILGGIELALVPASLGLLLAACGVTRLPRSRLAAAAILAVGVTLVAGGPLAILLVVPGLIVVAAIVELAAGRRQAWKPAILLTALTAITVAQPFGVRAMRREGNVRAPPHAQVPPTQTQTIDLLGTRILKFRLYRRERFDPLAGLGECCPPTHTLRVRSWVWPGLLTHATQLATLCGDDPCWDPGSRDRNRSLEFWKASRRWHVSLIDPRGQPPQAWRLTAGISSGWGAAYWAIAALLIIGAVRKRQPGDPPSVANEHGD